MDKAPDGAIRALTDAARLCRPRLRCEHPRRHVGRGHDGGFGLGLVWEAWRTQSWRFEDEEDRAVVEAGARSSPALRITCVHIVKSRQAPEELWRRKDERNASMAGFGDLGSD